MQNGKPYDASVTTALAYATGQSQSALTAADVSLSYGNHTL